MFNEQVLFLFQECASIFAIALTTIVVKVTVNLIIGQCGYGSHDKPDSVSNLKSPVASNVKWIQETPERVRGDHLESFTVKPDLTRAWYDSDQKGYNWADRRNDNVIANSGKGLNFLDFDNLSRQRISPLMQSEQQQKVPLPIINESIIRVIMTVQTCHSWVLTIIDEDDPCVILRDGRGCYKRITFYENYPELEMKPKLLP
ncbi:unnamed protein product [Brachionus calyciflorus]|uniref:Uncharacterized protein n=1 Tax=Brachionus calyciflorus TaxID=104777 RepID=A0A814GG11_9BILA|nr:unnamed protein product [Brachionus calyciflorus]